MRRMADVAGIGIGAPGPLNPITGVVLEAPNLPGWCNVPLRTLVSERFARPTFLGNDANVAGLAEYHYGAGRGIRDMIYLTISTGIGSGIIVDGRMLLGAEGLAAEAGHMIILPEWPRLRVRRARLPGSGGGRTGHRPRRGRQDQVGEEEPRDQAGRRRPEQGGRQGGERGGAAWRQGGHHRVPACGHIPGHRHRQPAAAVQPAHGGAGRQRHQIRPAALSIPCTRPSRRTRCRSTGKAWRSLRPRWATTWACWARPRWPSPRATAAA